MSRKGKPELTAMLKKKKRSCCSSEVSKTKKGRGKGDRRATMKKGSNAVQVGINGEKGGTKVVRKKLGKRGVASQKKSPVRKRRPKNRKKRSGDVGRLKGKNGGDARVKGKPGATKFLKYRRRSNGQGRERRPCRKKYNVNHQAPENEGEKRCGELR